MSHERNLSPPLATIESNLFGIGPALLEAVAQGKVSRAIAQSVRASEIWRDYEALPVKNGAAETSSRLPGIPEEAMPADISERIGRRVAARSRFTSSSLPSSGQIVEVSRIVTPQAYQMDGVMQVPLYVLLDAASDIKDVWHGWLASGETDYASWWDFVLQERDGDFDPDAGMVQIWNPVSLYLPMADRVVGALSLSRLQAVRALALSFLLNEPTSQTAFPGRVALRVLEGGARIVTGSPVGDDTDPRRHYQHLYFHAAEAIKEPARLAALALTEAPDPVRHLIDHLRRCGEWFGELLSPVPSVSYAMDGPSKSDAGVVGTAIAWEEMARLLVVRVDQAGGGVIEVTAAGAVPVDCLLRVGGVAEARYLAEPGAAPVTFRWTGTDSAVLSLVCGNRTFDLPLTS
jgi:hypothetical protein